MLKDSFENTYRGDAMEALLDDPECTSTGFMSWADDVFSGAMLLLINALFMWGIGGYMRDIVMTPRAVEAAGLQGTLPPH